MQCQELFVGSIAERLRVAQRHGEAKPDADIAGGARDRFGVVQQAIDTN